MSVLFEHIEALQGSTPWGRFLDAGTGWASLSWALNLPTDGLVAVTGSPARRQAMLADFASSLVDKDSLVLGNWVDEGFLEGQQFDTVLVDYLVGALDRFAPYYQTRILSRLKRHLRGNLYLVGLEPYPEAGEGDEDGILLAKLVALRDATILLSGDRPHREFPRWWVMEQLEAAGYEVTSSRSFAIAYGESFVKAELGVCRERLKTVPSPIRRTLATYEESLRDELLERVRRAPLRWGTDYVISARLSFGPGGEG